MFTAKPAVAGLAALLALASSPASARDDRTRVAVLEISGRGGAAVRTSVVDALRRVPEIDLALKVRSAAYTSEYPRLARAHRLEALVTGEVRGGKRPAVTLFVWRGDGSPGGKVVVRGSGGALRTLAARQVRPRLVPLLLRAGGGRPARPALAAAPAPVVPPEEPRPETPAKETSSDPFEAPPPVATAETAAERAPAGRPLVADLTLGLRVATRSYVYGGARTLMPAYQLRWVPLPSLAAEVYPMVALAPRALSGVLSHLGVFGTFERTVATASRWTGVQSYPTVMAGWSLGAKARVPLGPVELSVLASYGVDRFAVAEAPGGVPKPAVPDVTYRHLRAGLGLRHALGMRLALLAGAGWLHVLSTGELASASYFPSATGRGYDANAGAAFRIAAHFEARLRFDLRRYDFTLHSGEAALRVADRASDRYVGVTLGLCALL